MHRRPCVPVIVQWNIGKKRRPRPLGRLSSSRLPAVHLPPINPVICRGPYLVQSSGECRLEEGFPLRCFQRFTRPHVATQRCRCRQLAHQRCVQPGPLVLGSAPRTLPAPVADRDRTVSRRSEPSSRTAFMGEQPNPWDLLRPQDATSRHRGAKPCRRCGLLGRISLLSPG